MEQVKLILMISLCICGTIFTGCQSTTTYENYIPPVLEFEKESKYDIDIDNLKIGDPPNFMYAIERDGVFTEVDDESTATHILVSEEEFKKIEMLVDLAVGQREIIGQQKDLVNIKVEKINSLLSFLELERQMTIQYYYLWKSSDEAYRQERREHRIDNLMNRATMVTTIIGGMIAISL